MASLDDLDKARKELEDLHEFFQQFDNVYLPTSLRDAVNQDWELDQRVANFGMKLAYTHEEKSKDKMRAIKCRDVLTIMQDMEAGIVERAVVNPIDGVWRRIRFIETIAGLLLNHGVEIFKALWFVTKALLGRLWDSLLQLFYDPSGAVSSVLAAFSAAWVALVSVSVVMVVSILKQLTRSFGGVNFVRTVRTVLKERDSAHQRLLKKALPQSSGTRYFRRKETVT